MAKSEEELKFLHREKGIIKAKTENGVVCRELEILVYKNINPEDKRIAEEIGSQILDFARENDLTKSQAAELTYVEFIPIAIEYLYGNDWVTKPLVFKALSNDKLVEIRLNTSDSLMKSILLRGKGNCYALVFVAVHVLNNLDVKASDLALFRPRYSEYHAYLAIQYDQVKVDELKGSDFIAPAVIEIDKKQTHWLIYDIGRPYEEGYRMYLDSITSNKLGYLILFAMTKNQHKI